MKRVEVSSEGDPVLADYRNVRDAELRAESVFLVEGRLNVKRLLEGGRYRARSVFVTPAGLAGLGATLARLGDDTPVYVATQALMNRVVGYDLHRGCLAAAERVDAERFEAAWAAEGPAPRLWLALEDLTNPDNVGGAFRNALAFGARRVLLTPRCADPLYRKALRVSMGAALRLPFARAASWPGELDALRRAGFAVVALVAERGAPPLSALAFEKDAAGVLLVIGNEGEGVSAAARRRADARVTIPMAPGVDSLNAATASGIALQRVAQALGIVSG